MIPVRYMQGVWASRSSTVEFLVQEESNLNLSASNLYHLSSDPRCYLVVAEQLGLLPPYGLCDTPEQVLEHPKYSEVLNDPTRKFTVFLTLVRKEDQPEYYGFRWTKWGEYIGTQNPQCEYLYNETEIEEVLVFHILEHKQDQVTGKCEVTQSL